MINTFSLWLWHLQRLLHRVVIATWFIGVTAVFFGTSAEVKADLAFDVEHPPSASVRLEEQHVAQLFRERLKDRRPDAVDVASRDFLDLMRQNSPIASENLLAGKMDDEELASRVDVYLRDHPALTGAVVTTGSIDPRKRVADLLKRDASIAGSDVERLALADRFLERLAENSSMAHDDLVKGKMADEELQSRVTVYIADVHAETAAAAVDPKKAAAAAIVESYIKANFGLSTERANSISFRGEIEAKGTKRQFAMFKKRPGKLRMHIVEDGLVIGVFGFDGTTAWRQEPSKPATRLAGSEAATLLRSARFDDPLVDYRDRGATLRLDEKTEKGLIQLHLRETDGSEMIAEIDPTTFNELASRSREPGGQWVETRFSDYRKVGALNLAYVQEEWEQGKLKSTTRISAVTLDSGLLDQFFTCPSDLAMGYMDYMGGLALLKAQQKQHVPYLPQTAKKVP